ncbi:MAG: HD domain-containing phosphohydrolase [Candidatus Omnitrophota bacterium]
MSIDYKKELESAAKTMVLVHEPDTLIKMIARIFIQKVQIDHAGVLLYHKEKNAFVLSVSRGRLGSKIPVGFARIGKENPLIRFFQENLGKNFFTHNALVYDDAKKVIIDPNVDPTLRDVITQALYHIEMFDAVACIPSFYRNELLGILMLGRKNDGTGFDQSEIAFFMALASDVGIAIRNAQLFKSLETELENRRRLFINTTVALATAIDAKDHYTHGHTSRVTTICLEIANRYFHKTRRPPDQDFLEKLHIAALLHDIGKIGIPESILNKTGALTPEEARRIQEHPMVGVMILEPIKELGDALLGVKYHHERYDGTGYPEGLKGAAIPLIAAVIAIADTFDAMTTNRPYRYQMSKSESIAEIERMSGKQFDPAFCEIMAELYNEGKI